MRSVWLTLALSAVSFAAAAQDPGVLPEGVPRALPRGALFITPMGQPFRATTELPGPPILAWVHAADADGDGKIARAEFVGQGMAFFADVLDANDDSLATSSESTALWRNEAPEMLTGEAPAVQTPPRERRRLEPRNDGRVPIPVANARIVREQPTPMARFAITNDREPVMSCDGDINRRVTEEEFRACAERRFDLLDANDDGFFEIAESERARSLAGQ